MQVKKVFSAAARSGPDTTPTFHQPVSSPGAAGSIGGRTVQSNVSTRMQQTSPGADGCDEGAAGLRASVTKGATRLSSLSGASNLVAADDIVDYRPTTPVAMSG